LETSKGTVYGPKYVGGSTVFTNLKPKYKYSTHNYAFNIQKDELPTKLLMYDNRTFKKPTKVFIIKKLINPPLPASTRIIKLGDTLKTDNFAYCTLRYSEENYIVKGQYINKNYAICKAKTGYKFILLFLEITNIGKKVKDTPLYSGDGNFSVKTDKENIYDDISPYLNPTKERCQKTTKKEIYQRYPFLNDYAFRVYPGEKEILVKAFEIPKNSNPTEFNFRLLGDIEDVIVTIE
jgi:hypothetical protein